MSEMVSDALQRAQRQQEEAITASLEQFYRDRGLPDKVQIASDLVRVYIRGEAKGSGRRRLSSGAGFHQLNKLLLETYGAGLPAPEARTLNKPSVPQKPWDATGNGAEADGGRAAKGAEPKKKVSPVAKVRKSLLAGLRSGALHKAVDKMEADENEKADAIVQVDADKVGGWSAVRSKSPKAGALRRRKKAGADGGAASPPSPPSTSPPPVRAFAEKADGEHQDRMTGRAAFLEVLGNADELNKADFIHRCKKSPMFQHLERTDLEHLFKEVDASCQRDGKIDRKEFIKTLVAQQLSLGVWKNAKSFLSLYWGFVFFPFTFVASFRRLFTHTTKRSEKEKMQTQREKFAKYGRSIVKAGRQMFAKVGGAGPGDGVMQYTLEGFEFYADKRVAVTRDDPVLHDDRRFWHRFIPIMLDTLHASFNMDVSHWFIESCEMEGCKVCEKKLREAPTKSWLLYGCTNPSIDVASSCRVPHKLALGVGCVWALVWTSCILWGVLFFEVFEYTDDFFNEPNVSVVECMLGCLPFWALAFQLGMNYVSIQDTLAHRLIKKCTRQMELELLDISVMTHHLPKGFHLAKEKKARRPSWTDRLRSSPKLQDDAGRKKSWDFAVQRHEVQKKRTSFFDAGSMTGLAIDKLVEEETAKIVDVMAPKWHKRKVVAAILALPLAIMCPSQRVYYYGQPFLGGNGATGQAAAALAIVTSFIILAYYFIMCISVAERFSKVRWHTRIFTALLSEEDSSFILKGELIEMPFLNLQNPMSVVAWMELRSVYQTQRAQKKKIMQAILIVFVIAAIVCIVSIIVLVALGKSDDEMIKRIASSAQGFMLLSCIGWVTICAVLYLYFVLGPVSLLLVPPATYEDASVWG